MNKMKKEDVRKYKEARRGLNKEEIAALDAQDVIEAAIQALASTFHAEEFPEEYDIMGDSNADIKDRRKGINPMSQEYINQIRAKRAALGVSQLAKDGTPRSNDTRELCETKARKQILADPALKRPPSDSCIFCDKSLKKIGGKRITAQRNRAVCLSTKPQGGGDKFFPSRSVKLYEELDTYVLVRGEKDRWTDVLIQNARQEFLNGRQPWFCQICGSRTCSECDAPLKMPVGSDILYPDGTRSHVGMLGGDPGCANPDCSKYRRSE